MRENWEHNPHGRWDWIPIAVLFALMVLAPLAWMATQDGSASDDGPAVVDDYEPAHN